MTLAVVMVHIQCVLSLISVYVSVKISKYLMSTLYSVQMGVQGWSRQIEKDLHVR